MHKKPPELRSVLHQQNHSSLHQEGWASDAPRVGHGLGKTRGLKHGLRLKVRKGLRG